MSKTEQVEKLTNYMANFVSYIGKVLPDDIIAKLDELAEKEDSPLSKTIYQTMKLNQKLAKDLNRPSCQDTGVLQCWVENDAAQYQQMLLALRLPSQENTLYPEVLLAFLQYPDKFHFRKSQSAENTHEKQQHPHPLFPEQS